MLSYYYYYKIILRYGKKKKKLQTYYLKNDAETYPLKKCNDNILIIIPTRNILTSNTHIII